MTTTRLSTIAAIFSSLLLFQCCTQTTSIKDNDVITLETGTFTLKIGNDAVARSLVIKETGEEMIQKGTDVPLFSVTQDRPFNNEIKLEHPNTRTTYPANRLSWDGERLTIGFDTILYEAVVKVDFGRGYLRFILEDFTCSPEAFAGLTFDTPPVKEFRILQLPVKERERYGEWLNAMWDGKSAVCVAGCDPWAEIWHEDGTDGRILTADLYNGKKLRGGSAAIIAAPGKEPFLDVMDGFEEDMGLPRGVQSRRSPLLNRSIMWTYDANPSNIDEYIALAQKAGFKMILFYFSCFNKNEGYNYLGDYDLLEDLYPGGYADIEKMIAKVKAAGITPGFHTLQTHVGYKSRYVTPVVDARLNLKRLFTLKEAIPASGEVSEIIVEENPVDSPKADDTRILVFGGEAFSYEGYTTEPPYRFTGVKRGHYETRASSHAKGGIGGVLDVSEFGAWSIYINQDTDIQDEIAEKIARIYNCGFEFLYLDGSEGVNPPCGINVSLAQYRVARKLDKMPIFTEGAAKSHFGWHLQAGANAFDCFPPEIFKEKIVEFPYAESKRMENNMTRVDFGWWNITPKTTPEMWNFADSLAVERHCPVTIQFSLTSLAANPHADELLAVLKKWEEVRETEE